MVNLNEVHLLRCSTPEKIDVSVSVLYYDKVYLAFSTILGICQLDTAFPDGL